MKEEFRNLLQKKFYWKFQISNSNPLFKIDIIDRSFGSIFKLN